MIVRVDVDVELSAMPPKAAGKRGKAVGIDVNRGEVRGLNGVNRKEAGVPDAFVEGPKRSVT